MISLSLLFLAISLSIFGLMNVISQDSDDLGEEDLLTDEKRAKMTPAEILQEFKDGNKRFAEGKLRRRKFKKEVSATKEKQIPYAIVHSCIDSRVPVETIFDARIGEIFSTRLAGNVINDDVLGGMEFATSLSGAKLILVMGHTRCGAVKGAADSAKFGHLTTLVNKIKEAEPTAKATFDGEISTEGYDYVNHLAKVNVKYSVKKIRQESPILQELEEKGSILIAGAMYDICTGKIDFFEV